MRSNSISKLLTIVSIVLFIGGCTLILSACSKTAAPEKERVECKQPGSYFPDGEQRYILVDESYQELGDASVHCYIYTDKYMGTMYLYTVRQHFGQNYSESSTWDIILYEDGSPMIYNGGEG